MNIKEINGRLDNLSKRGFEGYAAKEDFQVNAESDIEYLLSIIEQDEKALEGISKVDLESDEQNQMEMMRLTLIALKSIQGDE